MPITHYVIQYKVGLVLLILCKNFAEGNQILFAYSGEVKLVLRVMGLYEIVCDLMCHCEIPRARKYREAYW